jgi:hypothetical protein
MKRKTSGANKPISVDRKTEKDADELVHSKIEKKPTEKGEEDADDIAHRQYKSAPDANSMADPDDLVHEESNNDE